MMGTGLVGTLLNGADWILEPGCMEDVRTTAGCRGKEGITIGMGPGSSSSAIASVSSGSRG